MHTCADVVEILTKAGFGQDVILQQIVDQQFLPDVSSPEQIKDPRHPCKGAVPREHSHFFTADGLFGSRDFDGQQVDDGTYKVLDDQTLEIRGSDRQTIRFRYHITGDTLRMEPVTKLSCTGCFERIWVIMMPFPDKTWTRVS